MVSDPGSPFFETVCGYRAGSVDTTGFPIRVTCKNCLKEHRIRESLDPLLDAIRWTLRGLRELGYSCGLIASYAEGRIGMRVLDCDIRQRTCDVDIVLPMRTKHRGRKSMCVYCSTIAPLYKGVCMECK